MRLQISEPKTPSHLLSGSEASDGHMGQEQYKKGKENKFLTEEEECIFIAKACIGRGISGNSSQCGNSRVCCLLRRESFHTSGALAVAAGMNTKCENLRKKKFYSTKRNC